MEEFNASLVREKIILTDDAPKDSARADAGSTTIRSNRILLKLGHRAATEKIVIRAQNMHTTLRFASRLLYHYHKGGSFLNRETPYDWDVQWDGVLSRYEKEFNQNSWAAVYINGKPMFKTTSSPFVDVIEQCALLTIDNYDATMTVTESALKQVGRAMRIQHSSNVATIFTDSGDSMRCGVIHRTEMRDTTFNFTATGGEQHNRTVQSLSVAADYLEAINLRFVIRGLQEKLRKGEIKNISPEANQIRMAAARQMSINKGIVSFEDVYTVKYRPEKPDFFSNV
jgi:hypothetical protein